MAGNICHFEIVVQDMAVARKFYGDIFGWRFTMPGEEYSLCETGGGLGGALWLQENHRPDGPVVLYIHVDDIPATLDRIAKAGGKTERPKTEIPGGFGFMAHFRDPSGNLMALWSRA